MESNEEYGKRIRDNAFNYSFISALGGLGLMFLGSAIYPPFMQNFLIWIPVIGVYFLLRWLLQPFFVMKMTGDKRLK